jgi:hypothetical protein
MISWSQICGNHVKIPSFVISERNLPNLVDMSQCDYVGASWMSATLYAGQRNGLNGWEVLQIVLKRKKI